MPTHPRIHARRMAVLAAQIKHIEVLRTAAVDHLANVGQAIGELQKYGLAIDQEQFHQAMDRAGWLIERLDPAEPNSWDVVPHLLEALEQMRKALAVLQRLYPSCRTGSGCVPESGAP